MFVLCWLPYLFVETPPELESESSWGGTTTEYWNAIWIVGTSDLLLSKEKVTVNLNKIASTWNVSDKHRYLVIEIISNYKR